MSRNAYAIEEYDENNGGRNNSPPIDPPPGGPMQGSRGPSKYGASPDVRNAVMDYYKTDKKQTTANLSALMNTVRARVRPPRPLGDGA
jgi:hypothetical protein